MLDIIIEMVVEVVRISRMVGLFWFGEDFAIVKSKNTFAAMEKRVCLSISVISHYISWLVPYFFLGHEIHHKNNDNYHNHHVFQDRLNSVIDISMCLRTMIILSSLS